jgi:tetratricopeptide (TPR) repeat protein
MSNRTIQIIFALGAIALILGLAFAPRLPLEARQVAKASPIDLEINRAVSLVQNGENPMEGIMILRGILAEDSTNVDVHWHLAQFSLTSRQIENAEKRFGKVIQFDDQNKYPEAFFWLAQTKMALEKPNEAIPLLEEYLTLETDTIVLTGVQRMLDQLKGNNIE